MTDAPKRIRIRACGRIQGVGFRPFIWNRATGLGLAGWVQNDSLGVVIEVQGNPNQIAVFLCDLEREIPPLAEIDSLSSEDVPIVDDQRFVIRPSATSEFQSTPISADISICDACLGEMRDPDDRRFRYPFVNCTNCGPRFTIIQDIPYDRAATTMKSFEMCDRCRSEYEDPSNRRFHAQPNACPQCGPAIWFSAGIDAASVSNPAPETAQTTSQVTADFATAIDAGQIVAVKGIGGFHLACDATNVHAIRELRKRKGRIDKPFAVMVADTDHARAFAEIDDDEQRSLESKERPIVLLRKRYDRRWNEMLNEVAPGIDLVGVMLPYSPLHYLLLENASALVMTSGNVTDEPIARTNTEAIQRLAPLVDGYVLHNRDIHSVCDDSVVRHVDGKPLPIRRSRGFAPLPMHLGRPGPSVLAIGGELKSTFCVTKDDYAYISQHIGDVGNLETLEALKRNVDHFTNLFRVEIEAVAADLHPDYLSSRWAAEFARSRGVPLISVQHHFAHAASLHCEYALDANQPLIACCFDGTGYGEDGAIWGGEFLVADGKRFVRHAHLDYVPLPGGDACITRPHRTALATLHSLGIPWDERLPCVDACTIGERRLLQRQLEQDLNCARCSSIGRLFDAVASLIGLRHRVNYEAQAAMELESLAWRAGNSVDPDRYAFEPIDPQSSQIGYRGLIAAICRDVLDGVDAATIAVQFHHAVAAMTTVVCQRLRRENDIGVVGLTGGVFQNALLSSLVTTRLRDAGFDVLSHANVPPGDGGISLGQAIVARNRLREHGLLEHWLLEL